MKPNRTAIVLGCLLIAGAFVPLTTAHIWTSGSATSKGLLLSDANCRSAGNAGTCTAHTGVSGTYVTPSGLAILQCITDRIQGPLVTVNDPPALPTPHPENIVLLPDCDTGTGSIGSMLCDMEVLAGTVSGVPTDEEHVGNNVDNGDPSTINPDGTWDDGGIGGACHTNSYNVAAYRDGGDCGNSAGDTVYAEDWLLGDEVGILVACDRATEAAGNPCLINAVISNLGGSVTDITDDTGDCIDDATSTPPNPDASDAGVYVSCGPDGSADSAVLGRGSGTTAPAGAATYPGLAGPRVNCATVPGDYAVFVVSVINADLLEEDTDDAYVAGSGSLGDVVLPAIGGWIDQP